MHTLVKSLRSSPPSPHRDILTNLARTFFAIAAHAAPQCMAISAALSWYRLKLPENRHWLMRQVDWVCLVSAIVFVLASVVTVMFHE